MRHLNLVRHVNVSVFAIIAMLSLVGTASATNPTAPDSEDFRRGRLSLRGKNWPLAIEHLTRAQEKFPDHPQILLGLAAAHQNSRQLLPAMAWYQAYLRLDVPEADALQAREQLESLDVVVRTMIDKLFAESVKLAEAAMRPTELAQGVIADGKQDIYPDIARSKSGDLHRLAMIQASAGLLSQAEATARLATVRHEVRVNHASPVGEPQGLEAVSWLALAETGSIGPLGDICRKLSDERNRDTFELRQLCHVHRYVMKRTPNACAVAAREFARDPALVHLDIEALGALRSGEGKPAHLALAEIARHASLALLRARSLALENWERESSNPEMPDETFAFLRDWLLAISDVDPVARASTRQPRLAGQSSYSGRVFSTHIPILARAFILVPNTHALTFQLRNQERWWPMLALVLQSDDSVAQTLAKEFTRIHYGPATLDEHRNTPLHVACGGANRMAIKVLLEGGGNVSIANNRGDTPLHCAAGSSMDEPDVIELLMTHKSNANARNFDGDTPVHLAAGRDCNKMIEALHQHGAKLEETNREGKTPLQIAKEKKYHDALECLQRLGARR